MSMSYGKSMLTNPFLVTFTAESKINAATGEDIIVTNAAENGVARPK